MNRTEINFEAQEFARFEADLVVRDKAGNPVGRKTIRTDSPYKLFQFFLRTSNRPRRKKKVEAAATSQTEINEALQEIDTYVTTEYEDNDGNTDGTN